MHTQCKAQEGRGGEGKGEAGGGVPVDKYGPLSAILFHRVVFNLQRCQEVETGDVR
jgi:hypothetical protein